MKHMITMTACLMILMAMLSQFIQNQQHLVQVERGSHAIDLFCADRDEDRLRDSLALTFDCRKADVSIGNKNGLLEVTVPVKNILASPSFWGVEESKNHGVYRWERNLSDG